MGEPRAGTTRNWRTAGLAAVGAACATTASGQAPKPSVVFSGLPAEVARQARLFAPDAEPPCVVFGVRLLGVPSSARLTTSGLGDARLAPAPLGTCPAARSAAWAPDIPLSATSGPQDVALRVGGAAAMAGFGAWKGRVIAYGAEGERGAAELSVIRRPALPLWPEFKWFVGFVLPALLAFAATRLGLRLSKAREERDALAVFRTVDKSVVDKTVAEVVTVLRAAKGDYEHPGWQVLETLRTNDVVKQVPSWRREPLLRLCEADRMDGVVRHLVQLFPLHAKDLQAAAKGAGLRTRGAP